jgi:hypothetical protein
MPELRAELFVIALGRFAIDARVINVAARLVELERIERRRAS